MTTQAQAVANRRNAARSTGPKTTQGKAVVAQNAIKHGLLARQNVITGEDPQKFDLHRREVIEDLEPVGTMESILAERIVSLTWRLKRAERLQNEVFEALLAKELKDSMSGFYAELSPEDEERLTGNPSTDPGFAIGRMVAEDYSDARALDRLQMYEQRIEYSLLRTSKELRIMRLERKADGGHNRPCETDSAKQSQSGAREGVHGMPYGTGPANNGAEEKALAGQEVTSDSAKQSQSPADLPCETKPISRGQGSETPAGHEMATDSAKQSQFIPPGE